MTHPIPQAHPPITLTTHTTSPPAHRSSFLTRRRFLPFDSSPSSSNTLESAHLSEARRREREAQRNLMDVHRETLRAAERTISLLREQIRLHDERARLSIASLAPLPAPVDTPARTPTQRAALERSLSSRIASLQVDIQREQLRAGLGGLMRRPETEALVEGRLSSTARSRHSISPPACPLTPFSATNEDSLASSDDWHSRDRLSNLPSPPGAHIPLRSSPGSMVGLEREWDRQLAGGEVDSYGMPIVPGKPISTTEQHPAPALSGSFARSGTTYVGRHKVDGLGLQLALISSRTTEPVKDPTPANPYQPVCLR